MTASLVVRLVSALTTSLKWALPPVVSMTRSDVVPVPVTVACRYTSPAVVVSVASLARVTAPP